MFAESGALFVCWMVQPVMVTSPMEPPVESSSTLAAGLPFGAWLYSMSQVPIWRLRTLPPRETIPPPPL